MSFMGRCLILNVALFLLVVVTFLVILFNLSFHSFMLKNLVNASSNIFYNKAVYVSAFHKVPDSVLLDTDTDTDTAITSSLLF